MLSRSVDSLSLRKAAASFRYLVNNQCLADRLYFLFVAHSPHHSLITCNAAVSTQYFALRRTLTSSSFIRKGEYYQYNCMYGFTNHSTYHGRKIRSLSPVYCPVAKFSTKCKQLQNKREVRERKLSHFKEEWVRILREHDVGEPFWSVKWIVQHILGGNHRHSDHKNRGPDLELSISQLKLANEMLNKRIQRVPVQYIIGEWDFRNVTLTMRQPVFIPEPETEVLVELVLKHCIGTSGGKTKTTPTFLDLCCGSGAIAVSLLHDNSELTGYAVDQSEEAVALTKENAERNHVSDRLSVHHCRIDQCVDLFRDQLGVEFDSIVSNPPYIPSADIPHLQREITEYYDWKALDGGEVGSKFISEILSLCRHILRPKGQLWLETGPGDVDTIEALLLGNPGWEMSYKSNHRDHLGRTRFHQLTRL